MHQVMKGIRVIEVAQYVFVPVASSVLAEWGADVIKVEPPLTGDAYRGLKRTGSLKTDGATNYAFEHANRGKRSIGLDLMTERGRSVLGQLLATADVLITNLLPDSRTRLGLDLDRVRKDNPQIIYARGTALGERGSEHNRGGYDHATYWARSGAQYGATPKGASRPSPMPSGAFGDTTAGLALAGGIAAALLSRERTGEATTVDLSLLGHGLWSMASSIAGALVHDEATDPLPRVPAFNPLAGTYRTQDGRWIVLGMLQGFHQWAEFTRCIERPDWALDPRFSTEATFGEHLQDVERALDELFGAAPLSHWRTVLSNLDAVWEVLQDPLEAANDAQTRSNGYINPRRLVASPVQFGEQPAHAGSAPEAGQQTEEILLSLGFSWDEIADLKRVGVTS